MCSDSIEIQQLFLFKQSFVFLVETSQTLLQTQVPGIKLLYSVAFYFLLLCGLGGSLSKVLPLTLPSVKILFPRGKCLFC